MAKLTEKKIIGQKAEPLNGLVYVKVAAFTELAA
jgi:hypothetical protein